jgi:hypothetical protein
MSFVFCNELQAVHIIGDYVHDCSYGQIQDGIGLYRGYTALVAGAVLSCLYMCYKKLRDAEKLRTFVWKQLEVSIDEHSFCALNTWSLKALQNLSLTEMKDRVKFFVVALSSPYEEKGYSEEHAEHLARLDALNRFNLYQFVFYRKIIRHWPEYATHILKTVKRLNYNKAFKQKVDDIQGFDHGEFTSYLIREGQRLHEANEALS